MACLKPPVERPDRAESAPECDLLDVERSRSEELFGVRELLLAQEVAKALAAGYLRCNGAQIDVVHTKELRKL